MLRETMVENALGLWWGETYDSVPINLGVVVSEREDPKSLRFKLQYKPKEKPRLRRGIAVRK